MGVSFHLHRTVRLPKAYCRKDGRHLHFRLSLSTVENEETELMTHIGERQIAHKRASNTDPKYIPLITVQ